MKNVSHQPDSAVSPSQNRSTNITSDGDGGGNSDNNQKEKKIDQNWTLLKGTQHRRDELDRRIKADAKLKNAKLESKQLTNQDIFGAKLYGVNFVLVFLMGICTVSVFYLCINILLKYCIWHTL